MMTHLAIIAVLSLAVFPATADYSTDSIRIATAKEIAGDIYKNIYQKVKESDIFQLKSNCKFNDRKKYTNMRIGDVSCEIKLYFEDRTFLPFVVSRVARKHEYISSLKCEKTKKKVINNTKVKGGKCVVTMKASKLQQMILEVSEIGNYAANICWNGEQHSTTCRFNDGKVPANQIRCVFDYKPNDTSEAIHSNLVKQNLIYELNTMTDRIGYVHTTNCEVNSENKVINDQEPGKIRCEIEMRPKQMIRVINSDTSPPRKMNASRLEEISFEVSEITEVTEVPEIEVTEVPEIDANAASLSLNGEIAAYTLLIAALITLA
ncbi:hypothetical protein PMAYCL1PPCAC_25639 [Pristionchus mayeri]|uniref:Uncharacterized protein n=1 Tax=Pristionchus mayeri TaxID=1317129 RepID=A0AAN5D317_9BILA|nr:hypothetical protein PMAYCL1PPCAC_25639 [Pristionchus mayeri]